MPRSKRNRIRFQVEKAAKMLDRLLEHLALAHLIAGEEHPAFIKSMPQIVEGVEMIRAVITAFRDEC